MVKILLVEDDEMNRDLLSRRLTRRGYTVILAVDGVEGLEVAYREMPDLILMDMTLPRISGWEASKQLKAAHTSAIPIIALTAHALSGAREDALASGCDDYESKPIELERLLSKIENLLRSGATPSGSR